MKPNTNLYGDIPRREPDFAIHFIIPPILFLLNYFILSLLLLDITSTSLIVLSGFNTIIFYIIFLLLLNKSYAKFLKEYEPVPRLKYVYFQVRMFFTGQFIVQGMVKRQSSKINKYPEYTPKQPEFQNIKPAQASRNTRLFQCPNCNTQFQTVDPVNFCPDCGWRINLQ